MDLTQISLAFPNVEQDGETASSDRNLISHFLLQKSLKCQNICVVIIIFSQTFVATTMQPELSIRSCKKIQLSLLYQPQKWPTSHTLLLKEETPIFLLRLRSFYCSSLTASIVC